LADHLHSRQSAEEIHRKFTEILTLLAEHHRSIDPG
jgi:hypothetical protein